MIIDMELMALDNPTSPFNSDVKAGTAAAIGPKQRMTNVFLISCENGVRQ